MVRWLDKPAEIWRAGTGYLSDIAAGNCRTPAGHPEGYLEAFANLYRNFALTIAARIDGVEPPAGASDFPGAADRSEEHTSELQSLMRNSYAVFCLKKKKKQN